VVGREFARGVLQDVTDPALDLAAALDRLKASGLIQQTGVGPEPAYRFKHALTQEVAYDSLLEHQRKSLHAAVGPRRRAAPRRPAGRARRAPRAALRARGGVAEAVRYGIQAAGRAAALSRYDDALGTLEQVERWVAHLPDDGARRDILADVLLRQERLYESLGDRARPAQDRGGADRAPRAARRVGPARAGVPAGGRRLHAAAAVRRAERALGRAAELSTALGDRAGEGSALRSIVLLRSYQRRLAEALESAERVLAIGRECGDVAAYAGDLATVGNLLRMMGEPERALRMLETGLDHVAAVGSAGAGGVPLCLRGVAQRAGRSRSGAGNPAARAGRGDRAARALDRLAHAAVHRTDPPRAGAHRGGARGVPAGRGREPPRALRRGARAGRCSR
jgi:tetratricopeptide (TPR) repeat protein